MSEDATNPFDAAADGNERTTSPVGFPRLRVIHLMAWMAATMVAFLPYAFLHAQIRSRLGAAITSQTLAATTMGATYGVATGGYLFVTIAVWYWKRKGYIEPLQPGHWLAFQGFVQWMLEAVAEVSMFSSIGTRFGLGQWLTIPYRLISVLIFLCFLWLAIRRQEPPRWRWTFAVMALAIFMKRLLMAPAVYSRWIDDPITASMPLAATAALPGLLLLAAMAGDLITRKRRHWSHWLGAGMRLAMLAATACMYASYFLFPQSLTGG